MSQSPIIVTLSSKVAPVFATAGAALGAVLAFLVGPVVSWMLERLDSAPAPLRLIDQLPFAWALPLLTILGALAGWILYSIWSEEVGRVIVDDRAVRIEGKKAATEFEREEIAQIFLDKDELVMLDGESREISRSASDSGLAKKLGAAFTAFGYPWVGVGHPEEAAFADWVDRSRQLEEADHALLRARRRALTDGRTGEAEGLREELAQRGVFVRDRGERQQYRVVRRGRE